MPNSLHQNPFRPGAGHTPPYLAGRKGESKEFRRLLGQDVILENMVLTGLRGVGKTVLLDTFRPEAIQAGWSWAGDVISESSSATEERLAIRLMTDLAVITSSIVIGEREMTGIGFQPDKRRIEQTFDYEMMCELFRKTPGLVSDKLKCVLECAWKCMQCEHRRGLVFAYDEAQNLSDHAATNEYPLSLLLDVFQSIQKKDIPFLLVLVGLPTLFQKLVAARTFSERMFHVLSIGRLNAEDSHDAIVEPIRQMRFWWNDGRSSHPGLSMRPVGIPISFSSSVGKSLTSSAKRPILSTQRCWFLFAISCESWTPISLPAVGRGLRIVKENCSRSLRARHR